MYWSKRHGRTTISIFDPDKHPLPNRVSADLTLAVAEVIAKRQVRAVFQPIVELATGRVIGYEGLVRPTAHPFVDAGTPLRRGRGRRPDRRARLRLPGDRGRGGRVDPRRTATSRSTCRPGRSRRPSSTPWPCAAGSPAWACRPSGSSWSSPSARRSRTSPGCGAGSRPVASLGVRVAADDVGAGNAGLRLLSLVPFDVVKIDLSLVQDAVTHETSAEILATLRDLATRRGAVVVAEGLETQQQLKLVLAAGIDAGQGYLLGRPSEATDGAADRHAGAPRREMRFGATFVEHIAS